MIWESIDRRLILVFTAEFCIAVLVRLVEAGRRPSLPPLEMTRRGMRLLLTYRTGQLLPDGYSVSRA